MAFLFSFTSLSVQAQGRSINLLSVEYGQTLGTDHKPQFSDLGIYGLAPIVTKKPWTLISFPFFNHTSIDNMELDVPSSNFYQIGLPLAIQTSLTQEKNIGAFIIPSMSSDLASPTDKNLSFSAALFLSNKSTSSLSLRYGIFYSNSINGQILIPAFNFDWSPTNKLRINAVNPLNPEVTYQLTPRYRLGLEFEYITKLYNLSKSSSNLYVADNRTILAPYVDINLIQNVVLNIQGGYAFQRKLEVYQGVDRSTSWYEGFKNRTPIMSQNQKGWFLQTGLSFEITPSPN